MLESVSLPGLNGVSTTEARKMQSRFDKLWVPMGFPIGTEMCPLGLG